jgi:tetratricopeptide (TPR) repeat protein
MAEKRGRARRRRLVLNRRAVLWLLIGGSIAFLALMLTAPFWVVAVLRLVPDRYVAAYAPAPIQEAVFDTDPFQMVPTAAVDTNAAEQLLENLEPTSSPASPTPLPTVQSASDAEAVIPPTQVIGGGGPTPTPGFVSEGGEIPTPGPPPASHYLTGFTHTYQGWNNCGPATITTTLSYWGVEATQKQAAAFLKPDPEDRNVRPDELAAYAESLGYGALVRVNGNLDVLKQLISAGFPVMVEKGFDPEPDRLGWMGHYLVLTGFSDADRVFHTMDSYLGPNLTESYDELDQFWWHFNRTYLVFYPPDQAEEIAAIIGEDMDYTAMHTHSIAFAQEQLNLNPNDAFGWFNLGSSLLALGDYQNAATAFDQARELGLPWRILWYQFGPYEAYYHVGRYDDMIALADSILVSSNNPYSEEAFFYRGMAYQAQDQIEKARQQYNQAIRLNTNYTRAIEALAALEGQP